jgi:hypothetical protein
VFNARIVVTPKTDVAAETAKLAHAARRHHFDDPKIDAMTESIRSALLDLQRECSETTALGMSVSISRTVKTSDYEVVLQFQSTNGAKSKKSGALSWLTRR